MGELIQQWNVVSDVTLNALEANQLLREAGIQVADAFAAYSLDEATATAADLGLPVQISPLSRERFPSQSNGVARLATSESGVRLAYEAVLDAALVWDPQAAASGVLVRRVSPPGVEIALAVVQDDLFGPVLTFGFGRMAIDIWDDVAYRILPLAAKDARLMPEEPRARALLRGYGTLEPPKASLLEKLLQQVSDLVEDTAEVWEMDLDPVYAYRDEIVVAGARIVLRNPNIDAGGV